MPFTHGNGAFNEDLIGVRSDPVDYRIIEGLIFWCADPFILAIRLELGTEDDGTAFCPGFDDLEEVVCLFICQRCEKKFIYDQQINFLVCPDLLQVCPFCAGSSEFVQEIRGTDIPDSQMVPAGCDPQSV